jgi:hypothetical protein
MSTLATPPRTVETLADQLERLGNVPPDRIRWKPYPGTATEQDVVDIKANEKRLCELVDGILVEKPMGWNESRLAVALISVLQPFVVARNLGVVSGEQGPFLLFTGLVRMPDVAFTAPFASPAISGLLPAIAA